MIGPLLLTAAVLGQCYSQSYSSSPQQFSAPAPMAESCYSSSYQSAPMAASSYQSAPMTASCYSSSYSSASLAQEVAMFGSSAGAMEMFASSGFLGVPMMEPMFVAPLRGGRERIRMRYRSRYRRW